MLWQSKVLLGTSAVAEYAWSQHENRLTLQSIAIKVFASASSTTCFFHSLLWSRMDTQQCGGILHRGDDDYVELISRCNRKLFQLRRPAENQSSKPACLRALIWCRTSSLQKHNYFEYCHPPQKAELHRREVENQWPKLSSLKVDNFLTKLSRICAPSMHE